MEITRRKLERMENPDHALYAAVHLEMLRLDRTLVADHPYDRALLAAREMRLEAERFDVRDNLGYLLLSGVMFHNDNHWISLLVQSVGGRFPPRVLSYRRVEGIGPCSCDLRSFRS